MNVEERREARRRRILENSETRLRKITSLSTNEHVLNGQLEFEKDKQEIDTLNHDLPYWPIPKNRVENATPVIFEDQQGFNYEPNHTLEEHTQKFKYEIKFSFITISHIILSQIVSILLYYDFGFLFGYSVLVPFLLSVIPELFTSKEQHDGVHMIVLLMLGFSQNLAKQISRSVKLASVIGKRFCVYIFCFTCSYVFLKNLYFDVNNKIHFSK